MTNLLYKLKWQKLYMRQSRFLCHSLECIF